MRRCNPESCTNCKSIVIMILLVKLIHMKLIEALRNYLFACCNYWNPQELTCYLLYSL